MRILFLSRTLPYLGGREMVVESLIGRFKQSDVVGVVTPDMGVRRPGVKIIPYQGRPGMVIRAVRSFRPQVINCHTFYLADLAMEISRSLSVPLVFTLHGVFLRLYGVKYRSAIKRICEGSDAVITVSENYRQQLKSSFSKEIRGKKVTLIRNGISTGGKGHAHADWSAVRRKYDLPLGKKIIIVPARINRIKGIKYAIAGAKRLNRDDAIFLFSAPKGRKNAEESALKSKLKRSLNRSTRTILFRSYSHAELLELLPACDLCLLPSLIEGISLSILEAMAAGVIVVATDVGGNPEIIKPGKNGFLIRPRSGGAIAEAVSKALALPERARLRITKAARDRIRTGFSEPKMIQSYRRVYSRAIANAYDQQ